MNRVLYEKYHKSIKLQKRIISSDDFTYRNILNKIDKYVPATGYALDIGSATGTISFYLASRGLSVDGIELSKNAVKYANLNKKNLAVTKVRFTNLPLEEFNSDKKYDLIVCFEVIEHLENDLKILDRISKLMGKDTILAISVPSINAPLYKIGLLDKFDREVGHLRRYSIKSMKNILKRSGLKILEEFKAEGPFRNLLFTNKFFGLIIKFTRFKIIKNIISTLDEISLRLFGESQLIFICKKK